MRAISERKIKEIRNKLEEKKLDAALFICSKNLYDSNIEYLTGFSFAKYNSTVCLLLTMDKNTLLVSPLEYEQVLAEAMCEEVISTNNLIKSLAEALKNMSSVGIIENAFPYKLYKELHNVRFEDITDDMLIVRSVKEKEEIKRIEQACKIANYGIKVIKEEISSKLSEKEMARILESEIIKKGADGLAFPTIVTSGKRSGFIHPFTTDHKIRGIGLIDFGVKYNGYCSDITVPFVKGEISSFQERIIRIVERVYQYTIDNIKVGVSTKELYELANDMMGNFGLKHALGHGLGIDVHEFPIISNKKDKKLKENMIFTIEPGIYSNKGGCRLENVVLLTKSRVKVLSESKVIRC